MEFNSDHKVIIQTLNQEQASAFVKFLYSEIIRHEDDIEQARQLIKYVNDEFALETDLKIGALND